MESPSKAAIMSSNLSVEGKLSKRNRTAFLPRPQTACSSLCETVIGKLIQNDNCFITNYKLARSHSLPPTRLKLIPKCSKYAETVLNISLRRDFLGWEFRWVGFRTEFAANLRRQFPHKKKHVQMQIICKVQIDEMTLRSFAGNCWIRWGVLIEISMEMLGGDIWELFKLVENYRWFCW